MSNIVNFTKLLLLYYGYDKSWVCLARCEKTPFIFMCLLVVHKSMTPRVINRELLGWTFLASSISPGCCLLSILSRPKLPCL